MLQFFRNFFKSKVGIIVTLAFLALIALAFASGDVANTGTFGGVSGGNRVAVVGDEKIGSADLSMNVNNALEQVRQQNPKLTMQAFLAQGGMNEVLDQMLSRSALAEFGRENGLRAGNRLVDSEILQIAAFRGADGSFNRDAFNAVLRQRGLSEATVRDDLAKGLLARQLITPVGLSAQVPQSFGRRYAALLLERRKGSIALLPNAVYAPEKGPTEEQLKAYFGAHGADYIRPERRVIRYATFGDEALGKLPAPTDAQIAERFNQNKAQYAATEKRTFTQVVAATESAARALADAAKGGKSLAAAAREKGLATTTVDDITQAELTNAASAAVAQAAFAAPQGSIATPAKGGLGWYVLHVDKIDKRPARTLAEVKGEISAALAAEQRRAAISDLTVRLEDEFQNGGSLSDVAKEIKVDLQSTKPVTADGRVYGSQSETIPPVLERVLQTAFEMDEGEPQVAEVVPGETFVIFDVPTITRSATAPLDDIREQVEADWRNAEGAKAAKAAADRVIARIKKGQTIAEAVAEEKKKLPAPDAIDLGRRELAERGQVPPPLALFFSMAQGTTKKLETDRLGWFVVKLDDVKAGDVKAGDPMINATVTQLATVAGDEYAQQFLAAVEKQIGTERNQPAIDAVARQLTGQSN